MTETFDLTPRWHKHKEITVPTLGGMVVTTTATQIRGVKNLLVTKSIMKDLWTVTHEPTGARLPIYFSSEENAIAFTVAMWDLAARLFARADLPKGSKSFWNFAKQCGIDPQEIKKLICRAIEELGARKLWFDK